MTRQKIAGRRCHSVRFISTPEGSVQRGVRGTIRHEMDNLDRHIVFVSWDNGLEGYVFPREIELLVSEEERPAA